jgi:hypothetical protein
MADEWVHAMFGVNYDDNYDTVMNRVIDHINYGGGGGNSGGNGVVNVGGNDEDDSSGTNDDDDSDDDSDENEDENYVDDEDESFWLQEFDRKKLLLCIVDALHMYYATYMHKKPCMVSYNTGI